MKKKINLQFMIVTLIAILTTLSLSTAVFYELFRNEVFEDLKTSAKVLENADVFENIDHISYDNHSSQIRITLVEPDGKVVYDNEANVATMDNHKNRPEIHTAFKKGEATQVRKSVTRQSNTFYYALLLDNGCVLRVGKEANNVWSIISTVIPMIVIMMLVLFGIIVVITRLLTKSIVSPIEQMANNMMDVQENHLYREIQPFVDMIQKQHQDIVKSSKIRQEFTANVTHELKTPLTAISGYSELIESGMAKKEDVQRFAKEIHRNSNRLLSLINDILRLSELDGSEEPEESESIDLYDVAKTAVGMLEVNANNHEISLHFDGESSVIVADRGMMEELVYNLTDNAIRYNNPGGSVWVRVHKEKYKTILNVKDNGIGISKENQERIFERFYRVDKSRSKQTGGTGLGLAIVKHIVEHHKAELFIESEIGKGTEIKIVFS